MIKSLSIFAAFLTVTGNPVLAQFEAPEVSRVRSDQLVPAVLHPLELSEDHDPLPNWYDFAVNLPRDVGSFAGLTVESRTLPTLVGVSALTAGLLATDNRTNLFSRGIYRRSRTVASLSDIFVSVGDGRTTLLLAGGLGAYGFAASDHRAVRTASQSLEALLATGVVVQTLKHIAGRESPGVATSGRGRWRPFPSFKSYDRHQSRYYAFPSGHMATTVAAVTVLTENYPEVGWLKPVGYSVVGLVGIGLADRGWHWYSDYPLGIALGYAFGKIVSHPEDEAEMVHASDMNLTLAPMTGERGKGLMLAMHF